MAKCARCGISIGIFSEYCERCRELIKYKTFAAHTPVDCEAFVDADYILDYDEMANTAFLDTRRRIEEFNNIDNIFALQLRMVCSNGVCIFIPRIRFKCKFNHSKFDESIDKIYIKIGENRYLSDNLTLKTLTKTTPTSTDELDEGNIILGPGDIDILREMATNNYKVKIRYGKGQANFTLEDSDIDYVKRYIGTCEKAGVFKQPAFKANSDAFLTITRYNQ